MVAMVSTLPTQLWAYNSINFWFLTPGGGDWLPYKSDGGARRTF